MNISCTIHALMWTLGPLLSGAKTAVPESFSLHCVFFFFCHVSRQIILHNLCFKEVRSISTIIQTKTFYFTTLVLFFNNPTSIFLCDTECLRYLGETEHLDCSSCTDTA